MHKSINNLIEIKKEINLKNPQLTNKVNIIAVSKTFNVEKILPLIEYGHLDFGENKVQEAVDKWTELKKNRNNLNLHMIGKLQTNKVKQAVKLFDYIHSLDSIKLAKKISVEQNKINKDIRIFIQINIANEEQKSGIKIENLSNFYQVCTKEFKLNIIGLMCLPPINRDPSEYFGLMKNLTKDLTLSNLSMGMSSDYLEAIKHEATFIRIGSSIFGQRS